MKEEKTIQISFMLKNIYQHAPKTIECFLHHYEYGQEARFTHKF